MSARHQYGRRLCPAHRKSDGAPSDVRARVGRRTTPQLRPLKDAIDSQAGHVKKLGQSLIECVFFAVVRGPHEKTKGPTNDQAAHPSQPAALFDSTANHHSQGTLVEGGRLAFFSGQIAWQSGSEQAPASLGARDRDRLQQPAQLPGQRQCRGCRYRQPACLYRGLDPRNGRGSPSAARSFLGETMPSLTGIGVSSLFGPDLKIEIEMVVRVPD